MRLHQYRRTDPSALYRLYDADDRLIYVGISYDPRARVQQHRTDKPWGSEIARHSIEWFDDRTSCEAAEAAIIASEHPPYNTQGGHTSRDAGRANDEEASGPLAEVVAAFNLIGQRELEYRAVLRRKLGSGVQQVDVAKALGRTREMIRRDAMTDERRSELRGATARIQN